MSKPERSMVMLSEPLVAVLAVLAVLVLLHNPGVANRTCGLSC